MTYINKQDELINPYKQLPDDEDLVDSMLSGFFTKTDDPEAPFYTLQDFIDWYLAQQRRQLVKEVEEMPTYRTARNIKTVNFDDVLELLKGEK